MKRILMTLGVISSLVALNASAMDQDPKAVVFDQSMVRTDRLGEMVHVGLDTDGYFAVRENGEFHRIQNADVSPELRKQILQDVLKHKMARKLQVKKYDNGEFKLEAADGLNGGGLGGAFLGSCIGTGLVHFIGHGTILIASACTGPLAPATFAALEAAFLPTVIVPAAHVAAIGGGIIGGVATGPV